MAHFRKDKKNKLFAFILLFFTITGIILVTLLLLYLHSSHQNYNEENLISEEVSQINSSIKLEQKKTKNLAAVFTGRWKFLRILIPYLFRELRQNGGALDEIEFIIVRCDNDTQEKLRKVVDMTNSLLGNTVAKITPIVHEPGSSYDDPYRGTFRAISYYFLERMNDPNLNIFKIDDDIIYIHPNTFETMSKEKDYERCNIHFGNIAGNNWRCNFIHQEMGVYQNQEINPKELKYEFNPLAKCGWEDPECAELSLRTFLYYYHKKQLDKFIMPGLYLMEKRERFSINFYLISQQMITTNVEAFFKASPFTDDDEHWWSLDYSIKTKSPNCVVGSGLVLHFSYYTTVEHLLRLDILEEFDKIVSLETGNVLPKKLWKALGFTIN